RRSPRRPESPAPPTPAGRPARSRRSSRRRRGVEAAQRAGEDRRGAQTPSDGPRRAALPAPRRRARPTYSSYAAAGVLGAAALAGVVRLADARFAGESGPVSTPSSQTNASSSDRFFAYMSSDARIFFALTYICFSPVERPFSPSRSERFRTTSASSK